MMLRHGWPHLKSRPQARRVFAATALVYIAALHAVRAADGPASVTEPDSAFAPGLATLRHVSGFVEDPPNKSPTDWKPNLQLLVGVKAVDGSKRTIYFVQLTTLPPPATNSEGAPWQPALRTNHWGWSPSNKTQFVTTLYPVRACVFDETGRLVKEGKTPMAWGMLTNGLMDLCRLSFETHGNQTNNLLNSSDEERVAGRSGGQKQSTPSKPRLDDRLMLATGGGFLWMIGMFSDLQTVPTVADVWAKAQCAIRWPSAWTLAKSLFTGLSLELLPRTEQVTRINVTAADHAGPLFCLPVDLNSDQRNLSRVEIIVGPAHGAEMLLAGIRSIHARHPTKPKHEFLAQVLAAGMGGEEK